MNYITKPELDQIGEVIDLMNTFKDGLEDPHIYVSVKVYDTNGEVLGSIDTFSGAYGFQPEEDDENA